MSNKELADELRAMKALGIRVSKAAIKAAETEDLSEYDSASVAEIASLFCELYN